MPKPKLSVVIVAYNAAQTIRQCLEALRRQSEREFEVIVVDSSEDDTAAIVELEFPEARLIRCAHRKYPGDARNAGVEVASADVIAFVDSDCLADAEWAREIVRAHAGPESEWRI